ncbi:Crp/Fnr family transcriptional regulator [Sphingobacterium corticibacter]|uniref:Crp/Fnr family transcriptional regulator n=1 Tax=Sphingobacterium corticibacter TaxID=2171749 RepID=A0A2T8HG31_9SPHI|nr:Crp/Fnr family transcriptional regulator [Sphingobacterium corticibacter]PVH24272.1 Crp/Fnr family transcriptional regulator [Sphingobacterium corticibacter]
MSFEEIVQQITLLPEHSLRALQDISSEISLPRGHLLFRHGVTNNNIYLIAKGIARGYVDMENTQATFGFFAEGKTLLSIKSYVHNSPGYENIELLEDCVLYQLRKDDLENLYAQDIDLANWGRKLADYSFLETEQQLIARQFKNTIERYEDFQRDFPELMNRVKLKHIASYLGMTQVTLSRIRAK